MVETQTALLLALADGDSYGLELIERVSTATGGRLRLMQGRVYPVLRAMESQGLIRSYESEALAERIGRPRRYYALTASGSRAARADARALAGLFARTLGAANGNA